MGDQPIENASPVEVNLPSGWSVIGASTRGISHTQRGQLCQDAQSSRVLSGGIALAVVADGAGTARLSDQGAQTAVREALAALEVALSSGVPQEAKTWQAVLLDAFVAARQAVFNLAQEQDENPREYACTLIAAAAAPGWLVTGSIGDGAVVARGEQGDLFTATRLQRGEYANETHFLVQDDALDQVVIDAFERPLGGFAVMSDGLIRLALKMPSQEPHRPFFDPLFQFVSSVENETDGVGQLASFLDSARVNQRTDDDKSLVLAVWRNAARGPG